MKARHFHPSHPHAPDRMRKESMFIQKSLVTLHLDHCEDSPLPNHKLWKLIWYYNQMSWYGGQGTFKHSTVLYWEQLLHLQSFESFETTQVWKHY